MSYFDRDSLRFLRGLARNNHKPWFEAHRGEYERHVKAPMADLVEEMALRLTGFAPEITGEPRRSIFRIHRDVRFSPDKSPYKTHCACWFYHADGSAKVGREAHGGGAGFYFHLQPGASLVGGGIWMPPRPALQRIRRAIATDLAGFERVALSPGMRRRFGPPDEDAVLKRVPRGWSADDPAARWLRYQSFTVSRPLRDVEVTSARLTRALQSDFAAMTPLVRWLNAALGLKPSGGR